MNQKMVLKADICDKIMKLKILNAKKKSGGWMGGSKSELLFFGHYHALALAFLFVFRTKMEG